MAEAPGTSVDVTSTGQKSDLLERPTALKATANSALSVFMAGCISGMVTSSIVQPFDVIKTRMQADALRPGSTAVARSMVDTARLIVQKQGVQGLWTATVRSTNYCSSNTSLRQGATCIRVGLGAGIYFLLLDKATTALRNYLASPEARRSAPPPQIQQGGLGGLSALQNLVTGAGSRSVAALVLTPVTVVKTRMEQGTVYSNTLTGLVTIARTERLRGLFSGVGPTILRDAPYSGIYLMLYERIRRDLQVLLPPSTSPLVVNFAAGALAGAAATVVTMPPDVVRTRLQLATGAGVRETAFQAAQSIVKARGIGGLWTGATPRVFRRTAQMAFTWTIYEELVTLFGGAQRVDMSKKII